MNANYQIAILSRSTGDLLTILDTIAVYQLRYSRILNDVGKCVLEIPYSEEYEELFTLDTFIEVYRTNPANNMELLKEGTYLARLFDRMENESGDERFIIGGVSLEHLLWRRLVDYRDDPLGAGGYSTKAGLGDDIILEYIDEQCGAVASAPRQYPAFTVAASGSVGQTVGARKTFKDNLLTVCQELAEQGAVDFYLERTSMNNIQAVSGVVGTDRSKGTNYPTNPFVYLSPMRGNLSQPRLTYDRRKEGNYLYAEGEGGGENRTLSEFIAAGTTDSPYNRSEFYMSKSSAQKEDSNQLQTAAIAKLQEKRAKIEFEFEPLSTGSGSVYREDWDLGDILTVGWGAIERDIRVMEIDVQVQDQGEIINITLEESL